LETNNNNRALVGVGFALLAVAMWSGNFVVASGLSEQMHPFSLVFFRWLTATVVFTPFAFRSVVRDWPIIKSHLPYLSLISTLGISIFTTIIYFAGRTSSALNMSLIALIFPIFVLIISAFVFKEKLTWIRLLGVLIVITGVSVIVTKGELAILLSLSFKLGDLLMVIAALTIAIYTVLLKKKPQGISVTGLQYSTFFTGTLILLPFYLFSEGQQSIWQLEPQVWLIILYIAVCSSIISFVSWNKAVDKIGPSKAGMIYFLIPLFSGVLAWIILGEALSLYHLVSGILIVGGIMITNKTSSN
jgi:drug/metabolite transporter (DMT)-like permease